MSIATARAQLKKMLAGPGFTAHKPNIFWAKTDEVVHAVRIDAVRRFPDKLDVTMGIWSPFGSGTEGEIERYLITEDIGDSCATPSGAWDIARFDADDVVRRIGMIGAAFTTAADIARHYEDRYADNWVRQALGGAAHPGLLDKLGAPRIAYPFPTRAAAAAGTAAILRAMETQLFGAGWVPCVGMGAGFWMRTQDDGGFHYCAYLLPNKTGTVATVMYFAATATDLRLPRADSAARNIACATKYAVRQNGLALQLSVLAHRPEELDTAKAMIRLETDAVPANAIRNP